MRRLLLTLTLVVLLALALVAPAAAVTTGAGGAGEAFGTHVVDHVTEMGGFTGEMNPGVHHQGFSGFDGHID